MRRDLPKTLICRAYETEKILALHTRWRKHLLRVQDGGDICNACEIENSLIYQTRGSLFHKGCRTRLDACSSLEGQFRPSEMKSVLWQSCCISTPNSWPRHQVVEQFVEAFYRQ